MNAPHFLPAWSETVGTNETNFNVHESVSNRDFLCTVYERTTPGVSPMVASFGGSPANATPSDWKGKVWTEQDSHFPTDTNNYFSLASFHPGEAGTYRRRKKHFAVLHAVMLDDIGTKVPSERLTLPPSWLIETSPGNYQAGYLLAEPLADGCVADRLMTAIVAAKLCDPGANGPCTRLARLPVGRNGKHVPPFRCRLTEWRPALRYTLDKLVAGLELDLAPTRRSAPRTDQQQSEDQAADASIWSPAPIENVVLAALRERGLYKTNLGNGKHDITCPCVHEHTDGIDGGTVYFEPDDARPIGGFKCQHGHCADRHIRELLSELGVTPTEARMKPFIRVVPGDIHLVVDAAERALAQAGGYYQRGGSIVRVVTDRGTKETRIQVVGQPALMAALSAAAIWEKFDGRSKKWRRTNPPVQVTAVLFDVGDYSHLPVLTGIARQPYLRQDGSLVKVTGYDADSGMFGVFDPDQFPLRERPTREDAEQALTALKELLRDFSFATDADRAAALSAMLTAAIRAVLPQAPMFHAGAHMSGSGKSYLCRVITAFATPQHGTPISFPADDEECRKLLLAQLLLGPAVLEFDNLTGDLVAHKSLCTALTSGYMTARVLGASRTETVSTRALFLSNGNNVGPVQDMSRRCVTINLSPQVEMPASRTFERPDLIAEVLRDRGRYVAAAMTIVLAWIAAGEPKMMCPPLAGFTRWSDLCRQSLLWLGCPDPAASVFDSIADDPDRETLASFMNAWYAEFGSAPATVRAAIDRTLACGGNIELHEILHDIAGEHGVINRKKLGWWIKRHAGQIIDGRRVAHVPGRGPVGKWRIEGVKSVSSVS